MEVHLNFLLFGLILLLFCVNEIEPKAQYVMPMSMGMKMSIPYDIANIFIRPIAGVTGVILSVALLIIIFFGIVTSPFGYFFGIPSRKYVLGNEGYDAKPRYLSENIFDFQSSFPSSCFNLMPSEDTTNRDCQLLAICHAHNALNHLPKIVVRVYGFFSEKLRELPLDFREAIIRGLGSNEACVEAYNFCPHSGFSLLVKTLIGFLPENFKNQNFRKRKGAMYE